jgi:hypothetical protein
MILRLTVSSLGRLLAPPINPDIQSTASNFSFQGAVLIALAPGRDRPDRLEIAPFGKRGTV